MNFLQPFQPSPESQIEPGSPLSIIRGRVAEVSDSVYGLAHNLDAIKELRRSNADTMIDPASRYFNNGYEKFLAHKTRQTNIAAATHKQVEMVKVNDIPASTETILDGKDNFDATAFDLIAEAQRLADEAYDSAQAPKQAPDLAQTVITAPVDQEVELQAMGAKDEDSEVSRLKDLANGFAKPNEDHHDHLAEVANRY
jgi:hypothetical protein